MIKKVIFTGIVLLLLLSAFTAGAVVTASGTVEAYPVTIEVDGKRVDCVYGYFTGATSIIYKHLQGAGLSCDWENAEVIPTPPPSETITPVPSVKTK